MKKTSYVFDSSFNFFLALVLSILITDRLSGQCVASDQIPGIVCENAPLICLQDWCSETTSFQSQSHFNFCGNNTVVNNPHYYAFIALDADVEIHIHVDYCYNGGNFALQAALLGICPWDIGDVIDCNPGSGPGQTMILNSFGFMIPGEQYYLLVDGSSASICGYTITQTNGIYIQEITGSLSQVSATPTNIVQGSEVFLDATSSLNFVHGYYWLPSWSNDTIFTSLPYTHFPVPCDVTPGIYSICVNGYSGCDTSKSTVCTEIQVLDLEDVTLNPSTFCPNQFPFEWLDLTITGPGIYTQQIQNPEGCLYNATWQIDIYPEFGPGIIDTNVCQIGFLYEGHLYNAPGIYDLHYPGAGINGCDSIAQLHLDMDSMNLFIETVCLDSGAVLKPEILYHFSISDSVFYSWYTCSYDSILSNSPIFSPDTTGCYCLVVDHGFCTDSICSTYLTDACAQTCSLVQETSCIGDTLLFTADKEVPADAIYHWLIDRPESPRQYYTGNDSIFLDYSLPGCYAASLTIVTADSTFTCLDSFCVLSPSSTATICCDQTSCDTCVTLTVDLSGTSPWTLYISEGANTDTILDVRTSPYMHIVCPSVDSTFLYQLTVSDSVNQCSSPISDSNLVSVHLNQNPVFTIVQKNDTLCAEKQEFAEYIWTDCNSGQVLSTSSCLIPSSNGCYCVEVTTQNGCSKMECFDFILNSILTIPETDILISPIPSSGLFNISLSNKIELPANWILVNAQGLTIETGILEEPFSTVQLKQVPPSGLYFLNTLSARHQTMTSKIAIETQQ